MAKETAILRVIFQVVAVIALLCGWYYVAADYDYAALSGIYIFRANEETCVLYLHSDQTFVQELNHSGTNETSRGRWHRSGESGVSFSIEFRKLSGEELNSAGEAYGHFEKALGIFPRLVLGPFTGGLTFHKKYLL